MITFGMIAPVVKASRKRHTRKDVLPVRKNCEEETMAHANICSGMNRSLFRVVHPHHVNNLSLSLYIPQVERILSVIIPDGTPRSVWET